MGLSNKYKRVSLDQIQVKREERQRRDLQIDEGMVQSVRTHGVMHPIIVTRELVLVAGERRLEASKQAGLLDIPVRFAEDMPREELEVLELEENIKRREMPWQDETRAIGRLHGIKLSQDPDWPQSETAKMIGIDPTVVSKYLRVFRDLENPKVQQSAGIAAAYNILSRVDERAGADALSEVLEAGTALLVRVETKASPGPELTEPLPKAESILHLDFLPWSMSYSGPKFNLIHCDFPYGIDVFAGPQSGAGKQTTYDDGEKVYWTLVKALCASLDRIMSHSGHLVFWLSADTDIVAATLEAFRTFAPSLNFWGKPLIWHKTDNVGILADPKRQPRHIYEMALVASREDRLIIKATSDVYGAPTDKAHHPSTKPEPVLRHFFQMFVDSNTRLLDPTCGSGSSLRAAESLGAELVLGLEKEKEHCEAAKSALRKFRALRGATK